MNQKLKENWKKTKEEELETNKDERISVKSALNRKKNWIGYILCGNEIMKGCTIPEYNYGGRQAKFGMWFGITDKF